MSRSLPSHPRLNQLKHQAKDLLRAHRRGDREACGTLRHLNRFAGARAEDILSASLGLTEAQYAVAMSYGFPSWAELKHHVEALSPSGTSDNGSSEAVYRYVAVNADRELVEDELEAVDLDGFMAAVKERGTFAVDILCSHDATAEHVPAPRPGGPLRRAQRGVELLVLQIRRLGWYEAVFDCTGETAMLRVRYLEGREPEVPLPTGLPAAAVLRVLRQMSGEEGLGRETVEGDREFLLGTGLPGAEPRRALLCFRSDQERPGLVGVVMRLPGSRGAIGATRDEALQHIERLARENATVDVLLGRGEPVTEVAGQLREKLGQERVGILARGAKETPPSPVVVGDAADLCFACLRARIAGTKERSAFRERPAGAVAVCLNVSREYTMTPCEIRPEPDVLLGSMRIVELLMLYGQVVELEEATGRA
jgi:hypothetical protein